MSGRHATCRTRLSGCLSVMGSTIARMFESVFKRTHNRLYRGLEWLVLPQANDRPTSAGQRGVGRPITLDIAPKFRGPVPLVRRRLSSMQWARVPEAPVDEHCNFPGGEDDVGTDFSRSGYQAMIFSVPVPSSVEGGAKRNLRLGVGPTVGLHISGSACVNGWGIATLLVRCPSGSLCTGLSHICTGWSRNAVLRKDTPHDWPVRRRPQHRKASL